MNNQTGKIRFGVVGTNFISDWVIAGGREDSRFEVAAVCSRTESKAHAFAEKHGIPYCFTSLKVMANSPLVDAIYIASPNLLHAEHSILCMQHGKHVLCEKPFATNVGEARLMAEVAAENGVVLMEAMKPTLTPGFRAVQENLSRVGTIRRYFSSYCQYSSRYDKLKEGIVLNAFKPELGNGALMDIGVYTIYPMVVLFGKPKTIEAAGIKLKTGADGQGAVNFGYPEMTATVLFSKIADSYLPTEIQGEEGTILLDRINIISNVSFISRSTKKKEDLTPALPHNEYYYEIAEFIDSIQSGRRESATNSLEHSIVTLEILDEIRRQLKVVFPGD